MASEPSGRLFLAIALCALTLFPKAGALQFYLETGHMQRRCFHDSVPSGVRVLGEYTVAAGFGQMTVELDVRSSDNTARLYYQPNIAHGKFAFIMPYSHEAPEVHHSEFKRRRQIPSGRDRRESGNPPPHSRRLLAVEHDLQNQHADFHADDQRGHQRASNHDPAMYHGEHGDGHGMDDFDDSIDWDYDEYSGIDEEALEREEREELERIHREDAERHLAHDHDMYGDAMMDDHEVETVFEERKFTICLEGRGDPSARRRVRLVVQTGDAAMDVHRLAKKEHMSTLEVKLRMIAAELSELLRQLERAHMMEEGLRAINEKTNSAVVKYAGFSILAMVVIGAIQARYTRGYFKQKKIA